MKFNDFYKAFKFVSTHPMCEDDETKENMFNRCLKINVIKSHFFTEKHETIIDEIWLELGEWGTRNKKVSYFLNLHGTGNTFEEAIINLANDIWERY